MIISQKSKKQTKQDSKIVCQGILHKTALKLYRNINNNRRNIIVRHIITVSGSCAGLIFCLISVLLFEKEQKGGKKEIRNYCHYSLRRKFDKFFIKK